MAVIVVSEGLSDLLDPPGSFATGTPSSSSIPLSWTYTDDNQTGFEIQRCGLISSLIG